MLNEYSKFMSWYILIIFSLSWVSQVSTIQRGQQTANVFLNPQAKERVTYHPNCSYKSKYSSLQALSPFLRKELRLHDSCLFNPSFVFMGNESLILVSFRTYRPLDMPCVTAGTQGGQWHAWLHGGAATIGYGLALLRRATSQGGSGKPVILAHLLVNDSNLEDARLWKDDRGHIRMMFNRFFPPLSTGHIKIAVQKVMVNPVTNRITLSQPEKGLIYLGSKRLEKNWVPWEGSTLMSYTNYPNLTPHSVLNWVSYDSPEVQLGSITDSRIPLLESIAAETGGWIRFSGGTPGVRLDAERFVAVGHVVGDMSCFHRPGEEGGRKAEGTMDLGPFHLCDKTQPWDGSEHQTSFGGKTKGHVLPGHNPWWDYFFFLYAWSAIPPFDVTHISHAFIPYDAYDHTGVVFPAGLQLLQSNGLLLSYGKGDDRLMFLTLGPHALSEMLAPVDDIDARQYQLCTISGPEEMDF